SREQGRFSVLLRFVAGQRALEDVHHVVGTGRPRVVDVAWSTVDDLHLHLEHAVVQVLGTRRTSLLPVADEVPERSEEHTSELQSRENLVCRLLLEKKKKK